MNERDIFLAALQQTDPGERTAYLDRACGDDAALRRRVETLLYAHAIAGSFLEHPAVAQVAATPRPQEYTQPVADDQVPLDFLQPGGRAGTLGRLGRHEVLEVVGRGGMGVVLKALDTELQRVVAIKVMHPQLACNAAARQRFRREGKAVAAISHDHVVTIHGVDEAGGVPYLVMQYVAGISLEDRLDRSGPLPLKEVLRIGMQTAAGLAAAHKQGITHRDVKPANILLENGVERVKLTDFGLARAIDDASVTQSGVISGTPMYMAPEQAAGEAVDHRADLFSLGSVLYALCTGRPPFRASGTMAVLKRVCEETPRPIREINPDIPDWLCAVVDRLHAKRPEDRFQSADEVAGLLEQQLAYLQQPGKEPPPPAVPKPPAPEPGPSNAERGVLGWGLRVGLNVAAIAFAVQVVLGGYLATRGRLFHWAVIASVAGLGLTLLMVLLWAGAKQLRRKSGALVRSRVLVTLLLLLPLAGAALLAVAFVHRKALERERQAAGGPPFVVLAGGNRAERWFATLAEAVAAAESGDAIEIRGNGPFVSDPIVIRGQALTIRAGDGFHPVLQLGPQGLDAHTPLLETNAPLVLEGLELHRVGTKRWEPGQPLHCVVRVQGASLRAANCRFMVRPHMDCVLLEQTALAELRNCMFVNAGDWATGVDWVCASGGRLILDNCVQAGGRGLSIHYKARDLKDATVELTRNTCLVDSVCTFLLDRVPGPAEPGPGVAVTAGHNVFDQGAVVLQVEQTGEWGLPSAEVQARLPRVLAWRENENVYSSGAGFAAWGLNDPSAGGLKTSGEWFRFWKANAGHTTLGRIRYQGGGLRGKAASAPESLAPADFRVLSIREGADVDLVGPGTAYARWKRTPAYRQWLKDARPPAK